MVFRELAGDLLGVARIEGLVGRFLKIAVVIFSLCLGLNIDMLDFELDRA